MRGGLDKSGQIAILFPVDHPAARGIAPYSCSRRFVLHLHPQWSFRHRATGTALILSIADPKRAKGVWAGLRAQGSVSMSLLLAISTLPLANRPNAVVSMSSHSWLAKRVGKKNRRMQWHVTT